jgi:polar amino acid transport system substrate-binding protein
MPSSDAISPELAKAGDLTVCMALMGAPASSLDLNGKVQGYNIAFANAFADRLNLAPVIQQVLFNEIPSDIAAHSCDISISSQNITSDRLAQMNLIPYTQSKQGFPVVVAFGNPQDIEATTNLCGQDVSAAKGTTNVDAVNGTGQYTGSGIDAQCQAAGLQPVQLHTYNVELDALQALLDGSVVAYLGNANYVSQYPTLIEDSQAALPSAEQGIGVALDHPNLTTAIEAALGAMIEDGNYVNLLTQFMSAPSVENISIAN